MTREDQKEIVKYYGQVLKDLHQAFDVAYEILTQERPKEEVVLENLPLEESDKMFIPTDCKSFEKKRCPKCGLVNHFVDGHTTQYNYCSQCGSKIKWGVNND